MSFDPHEDRNISPKGRDEWIIFVLFSGTMGFLFFLDLLVNFEPGKFSALFFLLAYIVFVFIHEASHALMAKVLNWHVEEVVIGFGKPVSKFKVGHIPVQICLFPLSGYVTTIPKDLIRPRIKNALIYFAGPGSSLLIADIILTILGVELLLTRTNHVGIIFLQSIVLAAMVNAIPNLFPHMVTVRGHQTPNDGLGIILSFLMPTSAFVVKRD